MNKQELLSIIRSSVQAGTITTEEIANELNVDIVKEPVSASITPAKHDGKFSASNLLYSIGVLILIIGIVTLVFRFWSDLSSSIRISITLGVSLVSFASALLLKTEESMKKIVRVLYAISAILLPIGVGIVLFEDISSFTRILLTSGTAIFAFIAGIILRNEKIGLVSQAVSGAILPISIFVAINEASTDAIGSGTMTLVAFGLFVIYIISLTVIGSIVYSFYSILYGTLTLYTLLTYTVITNQGMSVIMNVTDWYSYLTLALGICYLFLSSYVKQTTYTELTRILDFVGSVAIFGSILYLGGYTPTQSLLWEFIGILSLAGGLYFASLTQNKIFFKVTSIFIFIFIGKFTGEYFADSLGWPIALILGGLIFIGAGFGLMKFDKQIDVK